MSTIAWKQAGGEAPVQQISFLLILPQHAHKQSSFKNPDIFFNEFPFLPSTTCLTRESVQIQPSSARNFPFQVKLEGMKLL